MKKTFLWSSKDLKRPLVDMSWWTSFTGWQTRACTLSRTDRDQGKENSAANKSVKKIPLPNTYRALYLICTLLTKLGSKFRMHLRHSSGSSEPSPQSSTVSHFHQNGIHLSVLQRNCKRKERRKKTFDMNIYLFIFKQK